LEFTEFVEGAGGALGQCHGGLLVKLIPSIPSRAFEGENTARMRKEELRSDGASATKGFQKVAIHVVTLRTRSPRIRSTKRDSMEITSGRANKLSHLLRICDDKKMKAWQVSRKTLGGRWTGVFAPWIKGDTFPCGDNDK